MTFAIGYCIMFLCNKRLKKIKLKKLKRRREKSAHVALMCRMIRTTFWPNEARAHAVLKYPPDSIN